MDVDVQTKFFSDEQKGYNVIAKYRALIKSKR